MYHDIRTLIREEDELYSYLENVSAKANNLYNATLFRLRQVMTGIHKKPEERHPNEVEILTEIENTVPLHPILLYMPTAKRYRLGYKYMDALLKKSNNPDYFCKELPKHCAQHMIKNAVQDMKAFYAAKREFKKDPSKFTGEPKLPHYHKSGGHCTCYFSNQECVIHEIDGKRVLKFPKTKVTMELSDAFDPEWRIMQVTAEVYHDVYYLHIIMDDGNPTPELLNEEPTRICAIDVGVNNLAALTNNIGLPCLLFKGRALKSINQWYNKQYAKIKSEQTTGTTNKFEPTPESKRLSVYRENYINDYMHKVSKKIIIWCVENQIDTIVIGKNKFWKQEAHIGLEGTNTEKRNTQNFVQIPFSRFQFMLRYQCERQGIRYVEQEESYTSKASHIDKDDIPVYHPKANESYTFSGYRKSRGIYKLHGRKIQVNADLNGSANIGRKAFPDRYTCSTLYNSQVLICKHPDMPMVYDHLHK